MIEFIIFFLMIRRPPRSTLKHAFPTRRSSDLRDDLADIVVNRPAFLHSCDDRGKVVVEEHHVGGLAGRLGSLYSHRSANVSLLERRRVVDAVAGHRRSEEHTSELQSLMRISFAVFCLKK